MFPPQCGALQAPLTSQILPPTLVATNPLPECGYGGAARLRPYRQVSLCRQCVRNEPEPERHPELPAHDISPDTWHSPTQILVVPTASSTVNARIIHCR